MNPADLRWSIARYPAALIDRVALADGRAVTLRPVLPQDAELTQAFYRSLSPSSRYLRFHMGVASLSSAVLRAFTEIDYDGHLALLAEVFDDDDEERQVADARFVRRADAPIADFAVAVADDWQGVGLGSTLIDRMLAAARRRGIVRLDGEVLAVNRPMLGLLRGRGFALRTDPQDARLVRASISTGAAPPDAIGTPEDVAFAGG